VLRYLPGPPLTWPNHHTGLFHPLLTTTTQCSLNRLMSTSKDRRDRITSGGDTGIHTSSCIDKGNLWLREQLVPECRRNSGHLTTAAAAHLPPSTAAHLGCPWWRLSPRQPGDESCTQQASLAMMSPCYSIYRFMYRMSVSQQ
jgi:hypothetical protein